MRTKKPFNQFLLDYDVLVGTMPRALVTGTPAPAPPELVGYRVTCQGNQVVTQARFCTATAFTGSTDFYICVWNVDDGTLRARTAELSASVNGATDTVLTPALTASLSLRMGEEILLGFAAKGMSAGSLRGTSSLAAILALDPQMNFRTSTYAGGVPGTLALPGIAISRQPWIELLP